jgi:hypothetical protein
MLKKIVTIIIPLCVVCFNTSNAKSKKTEVKTQKQIEALQNSPSNLNASAQPQSQEARELTAKSQDLQVAKPDLQSLPLKSKSQNQPFYLNLAYEYSNLDYSMLTAADSVLKWRDLRGRGVALSFIEKKDEKKQSALRLNLKYANLSGGQMSDYDIKNAYHWNAPGVFSETEKMTGDYLKLQFLATTPLNVYKNSVLSFIGGLEAQNLNLDPNGVYQIYQGDTNVTYYNGDSQNVKMKTFGLNLGLRYKLETSPDGNYFAVQVQTYLPYYFSSKQYNWGYNIDGDYDWKLQSRGFSTMKNSRTLLLRLESVQKISKDISLNFYAFAESFKLKNLNEFDRNNPRLPANSGVVYFGNTKYTQLSTIGFGLGFII